MKYFIAISSIIICAAVYCVSSVGLAVHRVHAISVAAEIVQSQHLKDNERTSIERLVSSTGDASFYYSIISTTANVGAVVNLFAIGYWFFRRPHKI